MEVQGGRAGHNRGPRRAAEPCQSHLTSPRPKDSGILQPSAITLALMHTSDTPVALALYTCNLTSFGVLRGFYSLMHERTGRKW